MVSAMALTAALPAAAQVLQIEEIMVTAQRREQSLNDVGIAITAFSGEAMKDFGIEEAFDVAAFTPGLAMVANAGYSGKINYTLRGVGLNDFSEAQEAAVAIYQDDVYIASLSGSVGGAFDIERVEVLRGPQGTLFGRSASGGLVHYITKRPSQENDAYVNFGYGSYDERRAEAAANLVVSDKLSTRFSAYYNAYDGWLKNVSPLNSDDRYDEERWAVRGQALFTPSDTFDLLVRAEYSELTNDGGIVYLHGATYSDDPASPFSGEGTHFDVPADQDVYGIPFITGPGTDGLGFADTDGDFFAGWWDSPNSASRNDNERLMLSAEMNWDLSDTLTFTSVTGYIDVKKRYTDANYAGRPAWIDLFAVLGPDDPFNFLALTVDVDSKEFVQELRLFNEGERFRWTAGVFYLNWDLTNHNPAEFPLGTFVAGAPFGPDVFGVDVDQKKEAIALYGQAEYDLNEQVTMILGLRGEHESVDYVLDQTHDPFWGPELDYDDTVKNDYVSGTLELDWRPTDDMLVYGSVRRGIKPAAFNRPFLDISPAPIPVDEEKLWAYEVGAKATLGMFQVNGSVYYYDYKDYQAIFVKDAASALQNLDAEIYGLDLEISARPTDRLTLGAVLSLIEGKARDVGFDPSVGVVGDELLRDRDIPNAPPYSATIMAQYEIPLSDGSAIRLQGDVQFQGKTYYEIQNHPASTQDAYQVGNLRLSWLKGGLEVAATVKNVWQEEYAAYILDVNSFGGFKDVTPSKPRWWGLELRYRWGE